MMTTDPHNSRCGPGVQPLGDLLRFARWQTGTHLSTLLALLGLDVRRLHELHAAPWPDPESSTFHEQVAAIAVDLGADAEILAHLITVWTPRRLGYFAVAQAEAWLQRCGEEPRT